MARVRLRDPEETGGSYFTSDNKDVEFLHSGCTTLDCALGGGWAEGRIANIVGDKSTGKTLLCIEACANFIVKYPKGRIYYRESESAFDKGYASALGMPIDRVDFGKDPLETVEDLFEDLERVIASAKGPTLYICDSLDALSDRAELDRDMDKGSYGGDKAKKMSQMFRRLVQKLTRKKVTVIIVSQVRDKIGAMFGRKTTRSGGRALDFYASQVVYLAHLGTMHQTVKGQKRVTAVKVKAKLDKNKVSLPYREAEFSIKFGYGVDDAQACIDWLNATKTLKHLKIPAGDQKAYLETLLDMTPDRAARKLKEAQDLVKHHWMKIEEQVLPKRTKYGA